MSHPEITPASPTPPGPPFGRQPEARTAFLSDPLLLVPILCFLILSSAAIVLIYPLHWFNHHNLAAQRLVQEERYEEAAAHLHALTHCEGWWCDRAQFQAGHVRQLADLYLRLGRWQEARTEYERARTLLPALNLDREMAIINAELGRADEAMELLVKVMEKTPNDPAANYYMGLRLLEQGQYREAGQAFYRAAGDPEWDAKAEPLRRELAQRMLGGAAPSSSTLRHEG